MTELIFMLTQYDVTIPNAIQIFEDVKNTGIKYVGCKDIGLSMEEYEDYFNSEEVDRLFNESISDELAMKQILLLMREQPRSIEGFSEILGLNPSQISRYLNIAARKRLTSFDEDTSSFTLV